MAKAPPDLRAMWTILAVTCKVCDGEIPLRVDATNHDSMRDGAERLRELLAIHMVRDHLG